MANISAQMVGDLKKKTGAGLMDCKKALVETNGDVDAAIKLPLPLRRQIELPQKALLIS